MVPQVVLEICQPQKKFEEFVPLRGRVRAAFLRKGVHGEIGVGQEPVKHAGVNRSALLAEFEGRLQTQESLLEVVVEAERFACEGYRNGLATSSYPTRLRREFHCETHPETDKASPRCKLLASRRQSRR